MIQLTDTLWIGDSVDAGNIVALGIDAVLNVAHDLRSRTGWPQVEHMQVGLMDGPGNLPSVYHAAVLALVSLCLRYDSVLVCCHSGGRSLAVVLMYLHLTSGRGWDDILDGLIAKIDVDLPTVHPAHKLAFGKMNWRLLSSVMGD